MTRAQLIHSIAEAERQSSQALHSLRMLRKMVEFVLEVNGEEESPADPEALGRELAALAYSSKPTLKAWAVVCSRDPLLACLIGARRSYARVDNARGKGMKPLEVNASISYQAAHAAGFKGSRNQWEALLRLR